MYKKFKTNKMATRFYNSQARFFNQLLQGADFETIYKEATEKIEQTKYYCNDTQAEKYRQEEKNGLLEVKSFFDKMKFFEKPEVYAINGWGYDQTNYENLKIIGQVGGSMVCIVDNNYSDIYTISKSKYTKKEYANLEKDGVRSTSWREPYTSEAIQENARYNSYYGH